MVKIETNSNVYVVDRGGMLRWVTTLDIAKSMNGTQWATFVDGVSVTLFINYQIGQSLTVALKK